jgi:hypothetical protein
MGRALKAQNYERVKQRQSGVYGYLIEQRFKTSPLEI